jgi:ribosomal protein S8
LIGKPEKSIKKKFIELRKLKEEGFIGDIDYEHKKRDLLEEDDESERERNIKDVLAEYLELRDEGFITDKDYDYKKKKLLREF